MTAKPEPAQAPGMKRFWSYIGDVRSIVGWAGKGALVAPLVGLFTTIGPPWPSKLGVPPLTCLALVMFLIYAFHFWKRLPRKSLESRFRWSLWLAVASCVAYAVCFGLFVVDAPDADHRDAKGFVYTPTARNVIGPAYSEMDAFRGASYDPTTIWEPWSVVVARVALLGTWILAFGCASAYLASFVLLSSKPQTNTPSPRPSPRKAGQVDTG